MSENTLASHIWGRGSIPVKALCGKAGSCLPLVGSLQYRTLANSMYWFPLPFQLPVVEDVALSIMISYCYHLFILLIIVL